MSSSTPGKVALVTGASRGIGAACALALGKAGFQVAVHYRSKEQEAAAICESIGPSAKSFQADLADSSATQELIKNITQQMGPINILVNNAGIAVDQILAFAKLEDFENILNTNLKPVFLLSKLVVKGMIKQRGGRIINLTSVVGFTGNPGQSMYAASKAAVVGFTKSTALELAPFNILVNCVAPGFIETDMTAALPAAAREAILGKIPLKRMGAPDEVAAAVNFLASDAAAYITGTTLHVNGGMYTA